jgi:hypothetical protein
MFTSTSRIKNNSNLSSAAQSIGKSRKGNNQSSLNGNLNIQAKLTVGQPNDKYEQEADRVADQVMRTPEDARPGWRMSANDTVQRSCSSCMAEENPLNTKSLSTSISPLVQMQSVEEEEEVLQPRLLLQRQSIEEEEEESLQAKAAENSHNSITSKGKRLLAHELTHVVQQDNMKLQRTQMIQRKCTNAAGQVIYILRSSGNLGGYSKIKQGAQIWFQNRDTKPHTIKVIPKGLFLSNSNSFTVAPGAKLTTWASRTTKMKHGSIYDGPPAHRAVEDVTICP